MYLDFSLSEHDEENNESGEDEAKKVRKKVKPKVFKQPEVVKMRKPSLKKFRLSGILRLLFEFHFQ